MWRKQRVAPPMLGGIIEPFLPVPLTPRAYLLRLGWRPIWVLLVASALLHLSAGDLSPTTVAGHVLYLLVIVIAMTLERARKGWGVALFYAALPPFGIWLAQRNGVGWTLSPDLAGYSAALILPATAAAIRFDFRGVVLFLGYALVLGGLFLPVQPSQLPGVAWNVLLTLILGSQFAWLLRQAEQAVTELHRSALLDKLTGLGNRRAFDHLLDERWATGQRAFGVVMLDLDRLKQVNDTRGHAAGDQLLRQFAHLLRGHLHPDDPAFRLGGDEYAVLCPLERLGAVQHAVRRAVAQVREAGFPEADTSLGAASAAEAPDIGALIRLADERLYAEKRQKRRETRKEEREGQHS